MRTVFNAPPGWPVPEPGWLPAEGWRPDPAWPAPPEGWLFLLPDAHTALVRTFRVRGAVLLVAGATALGVALAGAAASSLWLGWDAVSVGLVALLGLVGLTYLVQAPVTVLGAERRAERFLARRPCVVVPVTSSSRRPTR